MKAAYIALAAMVVLLASSLPSEAHFRGGVWIGPGWGYGPGWWGPPAVSYVYTPPPVVIRQEPEVYIQQPAPQPAQQYWYYCTAPEGYYPYVKACPKGWMKVVPNPSPAPPESQE
jgi:hypothetical protein